MNSLILLKLQISFGFTRSQEKTFEFYIHSSPSLSTPLKDSASKRKKKKRISEGKKNQKVPGLVILRWGNESRFDSDVAMKYVRSAILLEWQTPRKLSSLWSQEISQPWPIYVRSALACSVSQTTLVSSITKRGKQRDAIY